MVLKSFRSERIVRRLLAVLATTTSTGRIFGGRLVMSVRRPGMTVDELWWRRLQTLEVVWRLRHIQSLSLHLSPMCRPDHVSRGSATWTGLATCSYEEVYEISVVAAGCGALVVTHESALKGGEAGPTQELPASRTTSEPLSRRWM